MSDVVIKWSLYTAVPAVLAAVGIVWRKLARRADLVAFLKALPPDCQGVLGEFVRQKSHTVILPPDQPPVAILENKRIITKAGSAGTFDAVAMYFTVSPDVYEIITKETRRPAISRTDHKHE
jgi:hypothetical protein